MTSRKDINEVISSVEDQKRRLKSQEGELIHVSGQDAYDSVCKYYDSVTAKLKKELRALPLGNRYIGTFYIRKPYTVPVEFLKVDGSLFMREDLVSWQIEAGCDDNYRNSYFRSVYKKPSLDERYEIKREDGEPVFAPVEEEAFD